MTLLSASRAFRMAAWFGIALLVCYLVFIGGGWGGIYVVQLRVTSLVLLVAVLVAWAVVAAARPAWRPRSAIWPALALPLAAIAVSAILSRSPRISVEYLAWAVVLVALYLLLQRLLANDFFRPRMMGLAVLLCAAIGVLYVAVCLERWVAWWGLVGHLAAPPLRPGFASITWGNPSAVMTIEVLLFAASAAHLGLAARGRRLAVALLAALTLAVTLLSGSRAGWLGLAIAVAVIAVAWVLVADNRATLRRLLATRVARVGVAVAGLAGIALLVALGPAIVSRAQSGGEALRASYLAAALRMGLESPVVGSGSGMWVVQRIAYTPSTEPDYYIPHAHDVYLQTFAEHGVLGLLAGVIAIGCLVWLVVRAIRSSDATRRRFGWCLLFAAAYFGAHQLLDFYPNMPAALFAFAIPVAWLDAASDRSIVPLATHPGLRRLAGAGLAVAIAVSFVFIGWSERSALAMDEAVRAANAGDWAATMGPAAEAVRLDAAMPANRFAEGLAAAHAGDLATAEAAFAATAAADDLPVAWLDLAAVQVAQGERDAARDSLRRALRLGDQQAAVAFAAGDLYRRLGDEDAARAAYVTALRLAPSLAGDPHWTSDPARAARWPALVDEALAAMPPESAVDAALSAGEISRARAIADTVDGPAARSFLLVVTDAWSGSDAAWADLQNAAAARPLDLGTLTWAARIAARRGDDAEVLRYRRWMDVVIGGAGAGGREVRVDWTHARSDELTGLSGEYYGHYTYRRATPWDQLVPGLPALVWR